MIQPKRVLLVFGTRPEAIKMAPLYLELKKHPQDLDVRVCVTAQHREMLDQVLNVFGIVPDIDLNLMKSGQTLYDVTTAVLTGMGKVLADERPDVVLVHGDTTTSMATALASFYAGIPIGHVEAGLRTHNLQAPFPEELNRQFTGKLSRWHFAPTERSRDNLLAEQVSPEQITITGNTVIDALMWVVDQIERDETKREALIARIDGLLPFPWQSSQYVVVTGHRRENFGDGFLQICKAIKELAIAYPGMQFVYPVHFNPNVRGPVGDILSGLANVHLIEPLDYEPFLYLLKNCHLVLTDSGGIQEEAPSLGKPVLVMRETTERPEAVDAGTVMLVGARKAKIFEGVAALVENEDLYRRMSRAHNPYGDGKACQRIVDVLRAI
nr:UDP-N-acetylglucosamine 2-epimerase (non-hydrolyzing) [uncultured Sphingomonas sp.]